MEATGPPAPVSPAMKPVAPPMTALPFQPSQKGLPLRPGLGGRRVQAPAKTMMTARIMTSGPASMRALTSAPGAAQTKLPRAKGTASIKR